MKVLHALLMWPGVASAFLLPQVPGLGPTASYSSTSPIEPNGDLVQFRPALADEQGAIRRTVASMLMNPLSINVDNFICAEEEGALVGFGQVRPIDGSNYELASLHVAESHRQRGIGSNLVRQLVKGYVATHGREQLQNLYLLTLADTATFYEKVGFKVVPIKDAPAVLKAESAVGSFLQSFFGNSLVCMQAVSD